MKSIATQLACVERELKMRRNAYPKWVTEGRMLQGAADHEIECMEALVMTLTKLKLLDEISTEMITKVPTPFK